MKAVFSLFSVLLLLVCAQACTNSYDCETGSCCVDSDGNILSDQELGAFGPPLEPVNGTCVERRAQKGELCDTHCKCRPGLRCYRPMSGVCCPPMTCYKTAYVKKQQHYWNKCLKDPNCHLPP